MDKIELLRNVANELEQKFHFKHKPLENVFLEEDYEYLADGSDAYHIVIAKDGIKSISYCSDPRDYGRWETVYTCVDDFFINRYFLDIGQYVNLLTNEKIREETGDTEDVHPVMLMLSNQYMENPKSWVYNKNISCNFRNAICKFIKTTNINQQLGYTSPKLEKQGAKWQGYFIVLFGILLAIFYIVEKRVDSSIFDFTYPLLCTYGLFFTSVMQIGDIYDNYQLKKRKIGFNKVDKLMTVGQKFSFITLIFLIFYTIMLYVNKNSTLYDIALYAVFIVCAMNMYLFYFKETK